MGVDAQPHFGTRIGQGRERRDGNDYVVPDTLDIYDNLVRSLLKERAAQMSDHESLLSQQPR